MSMSIYDTVALVGTVEQMKPPSSFLLDRFFPRIQTSETEMVAVDVFVGKRRLAAFCSPLVEGKVVEALGYSTNEFKPPYIKQKSRLDPLRPVRRQIGERIGGNLSAAEREQANLVFELEQHIQMVNRRLEWMAASALVNGSVLVSGEGFPDTTVNFGRDSSLSVTLTGGAKWGQSGVYPSEDIDDWAARVLKASGLVVTDLIFTPSTWKWFRKDPNVLNVVLSPQNAEPTLQVAGNRPRTGGQYRGTWGEYRLWVYFDWYIDPADGQEKAMIPDGTVLLVSEEMRGERAFASIIDPAFSYAALPYAPKSWVTEDPAARWLMVQSAPLVIPTAVNGCLAATVL